MEQYEENHAQQEQKTEAKPHRGATQAQLSLRLIVGGYLYYLIYKLITGGALQYTGWHLAVMIGAIVLFAGFGGYFIGKSLIDLVRHNYSDWHP